jgi:hypothetical protein
LPLGHDHHPPLHLLHLIFIFFFILHHHLISLLSRVYSSKSVIGRFHCLGHVQIIIEGEVQRSYIQVYSKRERDSLKKSSGRKKERDKELILHAIAHIIKRVIYCVRHQLNTYFLEPSQLPCRLIILTSSFELTMEITQMSTLAVYRYLSNPLPCIDFVIL